MKKNSLFFGKENLDEIVFANRNRAYGAYALRTEYSSQLTKAFLVGVAFFASLSLVPLAVSAFSASTADAAPMDPPPFEITDVTVPDDIKPAPASVPDHIKTVQSPIYNPVRNVTAVQNNPKPSDFEGAAIGQTTSAGTETTIASLPPVVVSGPPTVPPTVLIAKPIKDPNGIMDPTEVDVAAEFKGGINAFRQRVSQNFDADSVSEAGSVTAVITFVVERDGSISNLKINGASAAFNKEAARAVEAIRAKWTPAKLNGLPVRSSFRMPITMKID